VLGADGVRRASTLRTLLLDGIAEAADDAPS